MRISSFALLCLLAMLAWARPAYAAQAYDNCTGFITSIPAVISTQGTWCLKQDLATAITSGSAVTISTNNVTIDCNDFKLGGQGAGLATGAIGIDAASRLNATVRHCNIRGFAYGVNLQGSSGGGHVVEDNSLDGNTVGGITVEGDGSVVRRNRVFDTGGSTLVSSYALGIRVINSVDVLDNTVSGVVPRSGSNGYAYGILTISDPSGSINGNRVRGLLKDGTGFVVGIDNSTSDRVSVRNNDLVGDGSAGSTGLSCANANVAAKDNVLSAFATGILNCTGGGGNTIIP